MSTTVKVFIVLNLLLALAFMFVQMTLYATRENWKRRWNDDTKFFAEEVKAAQQKIADESFAKVKAEALVSSRVPSSAGSAAGPWRRRPSPRRRPT
jgi:hypothetical protein